MGNMALIFAAFAFAFASLASTVSAQNVSCKPIPGDVAWPSQSAWAQLNGSVNGRLIATVPQASVCHSQPYHNLDETECQTLRDAWDLAQTFELHPAEMASPVFQNQSCDPFTPTDQPCDLGNYAVYSINVSDAADIVAGLQFAQLHNVRLVIKNTGHDYLGKSTGKGSLALWTHNLKHSEILPYKSSYYNGTAAQIGAGVIAGELYALAASRNYRAVGGTCASIGVAGGYAAGGGHSLLNGLYGMAADNVLEWELVTANGEHIVATPTNEHSDLYWAMSGGGAGVWGVVLSMTTRIFVDGQVGGARLRFGAASADQTDQYWEAIEAWHVWLDSYVEGGNTVEYEVLATSFEAIGFTVPNQNADGVDKLLAPYLQVLDSLGLSYNYSSHTSPDYFHHFETDFGPLPYGRTPATTLLSNRLIPRSVVEDAESRTAFIQAIQNLTAYQDGYFFLGCEGVRVNSTNHPDNAVLPAWRDTLGVCSVTGFWDWTIPRAEMMARKEHLAYEVVPSFEKVTPGSGSYLNEADSFYTGNWTKEFYGANYARLSEVKAKYDPNHLFYAYTGVGSEFWESDANGRLCRVCTEG